MRRFLRQVLARLPLHIMTIDGAATNRQVRHPSFVLGAHRFCRGLLVSECSSRACCRVAVIVGRRILLLAIMRWYITASADWGAIAFGCSTPLRRKRFTKSQ
ncbi:hypothetical protein VFPPC_15490 [Pochonia chlamydosporia 170]|uniref:Uncharacterized protein n=1 Tax=Pochonia chlamydosporia 170 TaxID=1380566 RepID=A0A179FW33_METCM|nr:hypothetical protein VFPPC_15490 [Pochonia chlamydosporia 170]OAQ69812.1 hypothetical protein VFPPC_15490 [Pochonia chlamydosporia 170]